MNIVVDLMTGGDLVDGLNAHREAQLPTAPGGPARRPYENVGSGEGRRPCEKIGVGTVVWIFLRKTQGV